MDKLVKHKIAWNRLGILLGGVLVVIIILLVTNRGFAPLAKSYKSTFGIASTEAQKWSNDALLYRIEALTDNKGVLKKNTNTYFKSYFYSKSKDKTYIYEQNASGVNKGEEQAKNYYTIFGYAQRSADIFQKWNLSSDSPDWAKKCLAIEANKDAERLFMVIQPNSLSAKDRQKMDLICHADKDGRFEPVDITTIWE